MKWLQESRVTSVPWVLLAARSPTDTVGEKNQFSFRSSVYMGPREHGNVAYSYGVHDTLQEGGKA